MNEQNKSRTAESVEPDPFKVKKLPMQLAVGDDNLERKIKGAFDLAKSSGFELDLTFIGQAAYGS
jgi:hypothetical protein